MTPRQVPDLCRSPVGEAIYAKLPTFTGKTDGTHVTDWQSVWKRIRAAAGLEDVRLHDLRHSFASGGAAIGDSILIIGGLLGHSSPKPV